MFPTELWLTIAARVDEAEALLALAETSRSLHDISLHALFTMFGFNWRSKKLNLTSSSAKPSLLRGLCCWLDVSGQSVDEVVYGCEYDCGRTRRFSIALAYELRLLFRYFNKLGAVGRVTLRLYFPFDNEIEIIRQATIDLLQGVVGAKCREIDIDVTRRAPIEFVTVLPPQEGTRPSNEGGSYYLERCNVQKFPPLLRPFYFSTLQFNPVLTHLEFSDVYSGEIDFAILLLSLRLPSLDHFSLKHGSFFRLPIVKFLVNHPHIRSIEHHHVTYTPPSFLSEELSKQSTVLEHQAICGSLIQMHTTPTQSIAFFPTKLPKLQEVTLAISSDEANALEEALEILSTNGELTTLRLRVTSSGWRLALWLGRTLLAGSSVHMRPEQKMAKVETLILDNTFIEMDDTFYLRVIPWVGLFPAVKKLILQCEYRFWTEGRLPATEAEVPLSGTLASRLKITCPSLREVRVSTNFEWSHVYD